MSGNWSGGSEVLQYRSPCLSCYCFRKGLSPEYIVEVLLDSTELPRWAEDVHEHGYGEYPYGLVLPAAERNLMYILLQEFVTFEDARHILHSMVCTTTFVVRVTCIDLLISGTVPRARSFQAAASWRRQATERRAHWSDTL